MKEMEEMIKSGRIKRKGGPVSRPKQESDSDDGDHMMVTAVGGSLKNKEDQEQFKEFLNKMMKHGGSPPRHGTQKVAPATALKNNSPGMEMAPRHASHAAPNRSVNLMAAAQPQDDSDDPMGMGGNSIIAQARREAKALGY